MPAFGSILIIVSLLIGVNSMNYNYCMSTEDNLHIGVPKIIYGDACRSGGLPIRQLLRTYAVHCNYSLAVMFSCKESYVLFNNNKLNDYVLPCALRQIKQRNTPIENLDADRVHQIRALKEVDLVIGDIPYGLYQYLLDSNNNNLLNRNIRTSHNFSPKYLNRPHYLMTWLHDPLKLYVESIWLDSKSNLIEVINHMKTSLYNRKLDGDTGADSLFARYFLPGGMFTAKKMKNRNYALARIRIALDNHQFIGISNKNTISVNMLQCLLDPYLSLGKQYWIDARKLKSVVEDKVELEMEKNWQDPVTRIDILEYIRANSTLHLEIQNLLRFEYEVYEYGLELHYAHCKELKKTTCPKLECSFDPS